MKSTNILFFKRNRNGVNTWIKLAANYEQTIVYLIAIAISNHNTAIEIVHKKYFHIIIAYPFRNQKVIDIILM